MGPSSPSEKATPVRRHGTPWPSGSASATMSTRFTEPALANLKLFYNALFIKDYFEFFDLGIRLAFTGLESSNLEE
jgi:hypothetical protein